MIIPSQPPPVPPTQAAPTSPHQNAALASASVAAQKVARPTETQTRRAAAAVAQADKGRENTDGTFVGRAFDSEAQTVESQTNASRPKARGNRLDLSV